MLKRSMCVNAVGTRPQSCAALQKKLKVIDFSIAETVLYLDAYPECARALEHYHTLLREREAILEELLVQCGPTTPCNNVSTKSWDWVKGPWPWEFGAN